MTALIDWHTLLALAVGYLAGTIPFGLLFTRLAGLGDIRAIGSGNIGATNVLRTGNKSLAAATFLADALKGTAGALIGAALAGPAGAIAGGGAAIIGHVFPVWLSFKGGKGVATYLGAALGVCMAGSNCVRAGVGRERRRDALFVGERAGRDGGDAAGNDLPRRDGTGAGLRSAFRAPVVAARRQHPPPRRRIGIENRKGRVKPTGMPLSAAERRDVVRLIRSENIGPITFRDLVSHFGDAGTALDALPSLARTAGRAPKIATREDAERELEAIDEMGARLVALGEPDYPAWLAAIDDAPPVITIRGDVSVFTRPAAAIVGSRNASVAGRKFAQQIAAELGAAGIVVVSGLARGIDAAAHAAALDTGTIAVFAGGLDRPYPPENVALAEKIATHGGALVSEMPLGWEPRARDFPRRNRIVSGLSAAVIVVEGALRSGTLITARKAADQGRLVFAVPGSPLDPRAGATNLLIKEGASIVTSVDDIVAEMQPMLERQGEVAAGSRGTLGRRRRRARRNQRIRTDANTGSVEPGAGGDRRSHPLHGPQPGRRSTGADRARHRRAACPPPGRPRLAAELSGSGLAGSARGVGRVLLDHRQEVGEEAKVRLFRHFTQFLGDARDIPGRVGSCRWRSVLVSCHVVAAE